MAQPAWTSIDAPPYVVNGNIVKANQGNWTQGQGGDPLNEARFVFVWFLDGAHWYGDVPPQASPPGQHFEGEGHNVALVPAGKHRVRFDVHAGTHSRYLSQGGIEVYDVYEWGSGNVVTGAPYSVELDIDLGPAPPPVPDVRDVLREGVAQLKASYAYRAGFVNVRRGTDKCADALARLGG